MAFWAPVAAASRWEDADLAQAVQVGMARAAAAARVRAEAAHGGEGRDRHGAEEPHPPAHEGAYAEMQR